MRQPLRCWAFRSRWRRRSPTLPPPAGRIWTRPAAATCMSSRPAICTPARDIAKAIACGADAVMLGEPLTEAIEAPAGGWFWPTTAAHPVLPRGFAGAVRLRRRLAGAAAAGPRGQRRRHQQPVRRAAPGDGQVRLLRSQGVPEGRPDRPRLTGPTPALINFDGAHDRVDSQPVCPKTARFTSAAGFDSARSSPSCAGSRKAW